MAREATLEEVAESGRLSRGKFLKIVVGVFLLLFILGAVGLSILFSSDWFRRQLETAFGPAMKARGITFEGLEVSPLGKITLSNLRIRLPNGEELFVPVLEGYTNPGELVRGRAKATFDISELARQYLVKSRRRFQISEASKILYVSVSADIMNPKDLRGTIYLEGVRMDVTPPAERGAPFPIHFADGEISMIGDVLTASDLDFRLPGIKVGQDPDEDDLIMTFDGNIRKFFTTPEFVASKLETQIRTEPMWTRARNFLQLEEVSRKIRWYGPIEVGANLEGPIFNPEVQGRVRTQDLLLRMRGEFREIDILFEKISGDVVRSGAGGWTLALTGGEVHGQYFRLRDSDLPVPPGSQDDPPTVIAEKIRRLEQGVRKPRRLYLSAEAFKTRVTVQDRVMTLHDLAFACYGGRALGRLVWDLKQRRIQLGPGRFGDTAYEYRLGFEGLELGAFLQDVTAMERPMEGRLTGILEGRGRTLMLERMSGSGRVRVQDLRVGKPPRLDLLKEALSPTAAAMLQGIPLGDMQAEWNFQAGELQMPTFSVDGPAARLSGSLRYHILRVEIGGGLRLTLKAPGLVGKAALAAALGGASAIEVGFSGTVDSPEVRYRVRRAGTSP